MKSEPKFEIEQTKMSTFWLQRKDGKYDGLTLWMTSAAMWNSISAMRSLFRMPPFVFPCGPGMLN